MSASTDLSTASFGTTRLRWCVTAALFSLAFLTIVDRVCISAAKNDMSLDLGLSDNTFGLVFGAFALGYAILQVPSGWLADRYGPRAFLTGVVLLWSLLTGATGLVYASATLIGVRFVFGLAEAGAFPAAGRAIYNWLPPEERGRAQGILFVGSRLGAAFGLAVMPFSILRVGWRASFLLLGAVGIVWALLWFAWFRDRPAGRLPSQTARSEPAPWRALLLARGVPELMFQYFASNFTYFLCFSWLLPYLKSQYHLTNAEAGVYASMPLYFGAVAHWTSGVAVDALYRRGWRRQSRLLPAVSGFVLAAAALIAAASMPTVLGAVVCFAVATFGADLTLCPSWTACMDIAHEHTGTLTGVMNMAGNIGSVVSSVTFPFLLDLTKSAKSYFLLAAFLNLAGAACWLRVRPNDARRHS